MEAQIDELRDAEKVKAQAIPILETAKCLKVEDDASFEKAGTFVVEIKERIKNVVAFFAPMKESAYRAHKVICNKETEVVSLYEQAIQIVNRPLIAYREKVEREQREAEARLQAEQRRVEEESRLREAEELEKVGEHELAEQVISEPINITPTVLPKATPKVSGLAFEDYYYGEIVNKESLIRGIAEKKVPMAVVSFDQGYINKQCNAMGPDLGWPGVIVRKGTRPRGTGRR